MCVFNYIYTILPQAFISVFFFPLVPKDDVLLLFYSAFLLLNDTKHPYWLSRASLASYIYIYNVSSVPVPLLFL